MEAFVAVVALIALAAVVVMGVRVLVGSAALRHSVRRPSAWLVAGPVTLACLALGVPFLYDLSDEAPPPLSFADAPAAPSTSQATSTSLGLAPASVATDPSTSATTPADPGTTAAPDEPTTAAPTTAAPSAVAGAWRVGPRSVAGYRVEEVQLISDNTVAGRTDQVTGDMTIDGTTVQTASFTVDMASVRTDNAMRDEQYRGRIMSTDQHPTSHFVLTEAIDFGSVPPEREVIEVQATGELTLRGTTRDVTFPLQARRVGDRIEVLGSIPVRWADYNIPEPSNAIFRVEDHGTIEFLLLFDRAG